MIKITVPQQELLIRITSGMWKNKNDDGSISYSIYFQVFEEELDVLYYPALGQCDITLGVEIQFDTLRCLLRDFAGELQDAYDLVNSHTNPSYTSPLECQDCHRRKSDVKNTLCPFEGENHETFVQIQVCRDCYLERRDKI